MIVIINNDMGNPASIFNMLKKIGVEAKVSSHPEDIASADKLILPGIGSFDAGMTNLERMGLIPMLNQKILKEKTPILGICLGMQLMTKGSTEGQLNGLGWLDSTTIRFNFAKSPHLKIPHMGWNMVKVIKKQTIFNNFIETPRFYFVHSYHVVCNDPGDVMTTTSYGYDFTSSFQRDNLYGVQFHPEKSHQFGMKLLESFSKINS